MRNQLSRLSGLLAGSIQPYPPIIRPVGPNEVRLPPTEFMLNPINIQQLSIEIGKIETAFGKDNIVRPMSQRGCAEWATYNHWSFEGVLSEWNGRRIDPLDLNVPEILGADSDESCNWLWRFLKQWSETPPKKISAEMRTRIPVLTGAKLIHDYEQKGPRS